MRPHPRIRKTVKWGGAVASLLLLVAWGVSGWTVLRCGSSPAMYAGVEFGRAYVGGREFDLPGDTSGTDFFIGVPGRHRLWFTWHSGPNFWELHVPLWVPTVIAIGVTVTVWRLDTLARRRAKLGSCPNCSYSRTGLAPTAVCPECGTPAVSPPPSAS